MPWKTEVRTNIAYRFNTNERNHNTDHFVCLSTNPSSIIKILSSTIFTRIATKATKHEKKQGHKTALQDHTATTGNQTTVENNDCNIIYKWLRLHLQSE